MHSNQFLIFNYDNPSKPFIFILPLKAHRFLRFDFVNPSKSLITILPPNVDTSTQALILYEFNPDNPFNH